MPNAPSLAQLAAVHILVHCPVSGVGRLNGSLLSAYVKTSRSYCVPGLGRRTERRGKDRLGWTAHFMCIVCCWKDGATVSHCVSGFWKRRDGSRASFARVGGRIVWVDGTFHVRRLLLERWCGCGSEGEAKGRFSCFLHLGRRKDRLGGRHISCAPSVAGEMVRLCLGL